MGSARAIAGPSRRVVVVLAMMGTALVAGTTSGSVEAFSNSSPVANDDIVPGFTLDEDDPGTILDVLANDTDPDPGDILTVQSVSQPALGGVASVVSGQAVFTPSPDFNGGVTFTYTVTDGNGGTDVASVHVHIQAVNDPPVPVDDNIEVDENGFLRFQPWRNDVDPEGLQLTVVSVTQPPTGQGSALVTGQGLFVDYQGEPGFVGMTSFTYTVSDADAGTAVGTVFVNVQAANQTPIANDDSGTAIQNGGSILIDVVANDTDPNDDDLLVVTVTDPPHGITQLVENKVVYTPATDYFGQDSFSYIVSDGRGGSDQAVVRLVVDEANPNQPPVAVDDELDVDPGVLNHLDVLANDTDPEGTELRIVSVIQPIPATAGRVQVSADGKTIVLSALPGFTGRARMFYIIADEGGKSDNAFAFLNSTTPQLCNGLPITIDMMLNGGSGTGTAGDDVIMGTSGDDVIDGGDGNDTICAGDGDDRVVGGDGDDTLLGEGGRDILRGNPGDDTIKGGDDDDRLLGGIGDDTIIGGGGDDYIGGFGGNDIIDGGAGNETIFGGFGADTINGGVGADFVFGLIGNDIIDGGGGNDILSGDRGNDTINGGSGADTIRGGNANDTLNGDAGDDSVSGGKADDALSGGPDIDVCVGNLQTTADTADATCETILGVP